MPLAPWQKKGCLFCEADLPHESHSSLLETAREGYNVQHLQRLARELKEQDAKDARARSVENSSTTGT